MFIKFNGVNKSFGSKENRVGVLKEISTDIEKGEICSILGPSGSGKSTFLNILGGLDRIDAGMIKVANYNIGDLKYKGLADYRRDFLGFVFQFYNLVPNLTVYENIQVCQYLSKSPLDIDELLETLNMSEHADKYPSQISGGQQQRCAIARALVKNPLILLCDEPTGALDSKSAKDIFVLLEAVNRKYSTTIVIVSHNELVEEMSDHVIRLKDGKIVYDKKNDSKICAADIEW